eukprot:scaffold293_cov375-Pavlova_lutheri.AAC.1
MRRHASAPTPRNQNDASVQQHAIVHRTRRSSSGEVMQCHVRTLHNVVGCIRLRPRNAPTSARRYTDSDVSLPDGRSVNGWIM